jgi:hypothetical protein
MAGVFYIFLSSRRKPGSTARPGIKHHRFAQTDKWIPAGAGMTVKESQDDSEKKAGMTGEENAG